MKIIVSIGDPNGVGLEVLAKALEVLDRTGELEEIKVSVAGNTSTILEYFALAGRKIDISNRIWNIGTSGVRIVDVTDDFGVSFGAITSGSGQVSVDSIKYALSRTIDGDYDAMVTLPITKAAIYKAGIRFGGHTEMIAKACEVHNPVMILFHNNFRIALATIHTAIHDIQFELTLRKIVDTATTFARSLTEDFGISSPRVAILGLNPHAGEEGAIGREELEIIKPAIEKIKARGVRAEGPFAADGFFGFGEYKEFDGIIAMYHDQGLIPLKLLAEGDGVNFTAGLPIVRTSPDHGTALSIAGKWLADEKSTVAAIRNAVKIASTRKGKK